MNFGRCRYSMKWSLLLWWKVFASRWKQEFLCANWPGNLQSFPRGKGQGCHTFCSYRSRRDWCRRSGCRSRWPPCTQTPPSRPCWHPWSWDASCLSEIGPSYAKLNGHPETRIRALKSLVEMATAHFGTHLVPLDHWLWWSDDGAQKFDGVSDFGHVILQIVWHRLWWPWKINE